MPELHQIYRVTSFSMIGPYTLKIGFDDGSSRQINFLPLLHGEVYGALNDLDLFGQVKLDPEVHTLVWPNGADFDPATLHDWPQDSSDVKISIEKWVQSHEAIP